MGTTVSSVSVKEVPHSSSLPSRWQTSVLTTTRSARLRSTNISTPSFVMDISTFICVPTTIEMIKHYQDLLTSSGRLERRESDATGYYQAYSVGVELSYGGNDDCLQHGEGSYQDTDRPADPGHHQDRLPPGHVHPEVLPQKTGHGHEDNR